jgi:hypothetical protein
LHRTTRDQTFGLAHRRFQKHHRRLYCHTFLCPNNLITVITSLIMSSAVKTSTPQTEGLSGGQRPSPPLLDQSSIIAKKQQQPQQQQQQSSPPKKQQNKSKAEAGSSGPVQYKRASAPPGSLKEDQQQATIAVPVYTKPPILCLPPTAVLTKQEMDFRANLLNPNNDLFWHARGLVRPPMLADALAQGHAILQHEGHLTQKQGGRRLSAQLGHSSASSAASASWNGTTMPSPSHSSSLGLSTIGTGIHGIVTHCEVPEMAQMGGGGAIWQSAAPAGMIPVVTKEEMDLRANRLNPNNDVFWTSRGLVRPPVLADALAQGHLILQKEGHLTQTQTHKTRGRLNSQPTVLKPFGNSWRSTPTSQGPSTGGGIRIGSGRKNNQEPMHRRASMAAVMPAPLLSSEIITKEEVDLRANLMNPNNSVFWTYRGLARPMDLQEALAKGHEILEAEGHTTHSQQSVRARPFSRRGSRVELQQPIVVAANRMMLPTSSAFQQSNPSARAGVSTQPSGFTRHPDWQPNPQQLRRRYSLPPPGFELFSGVSPAHFGLMPKRPQQVQHHPQATLQEGAADREWDKMDEMAATQRPLSYNIPKEESNPASGDAKEGRSQKSEEKKEETLAPESRAEEDDAWESREEDPHPLDSNQEAKALDSAEKKTEPTKEGEPPVESERSSKSANV